MASGPTNPTSGNDHPASDGGTSTAPGPLRCKKSVPREECCSAEPQDLHQLRPLQYQGAHTGNAAKNQGNIAKRTDRND